jgi:hypothetical protein
MRTVTVIGVVASALVPSSHDLCTRVWSRYREPVEKLWIRCVKGRRTLEDAIDGVVSAIPR